MPAQNRRILLFVFITFLIVFETIVYVTITPFQGERFFQFYLLGANRTAADYYPNNDPNIRLGESVGWHVGVTDLMGSVQLVMIRIKLGNQSFNPPDDLAGTSSPAPVVAEFSRFIQDNETWEMPFVWLITNISSLGGSMRISQLQINNETYQLQDLSALNGYNFRLIFELWTWNEDAASFQFGWFTGSEHRVSWLQVWFNETGSPG